MCCKTALQIIKSNLLRFFMRNSERYMPALRALQLEEELNLPTHIPLPKIQQNQEAPNNAKYAG